MQMQKGTDQILIEELFEELPGLRGYGFTEARPDIDSSWITIRLKDPQNADVILRILPDGSLAGHKNAIKRALIAHDPSVLDEPNSKENIQSVRYTGEVRLRMGNAPCKIGTRIKMGNRPDTYEVTRIEPNGLCFGIHVDYLQKFRLNCSNWLFAFVDCRVDDPLSDFSPITFPS